VLQIPQVFANVSKGVKAKPADMERVFGTTDQEEACKLILQKGELQLSEKEREVHQDQLFRDVVTFVAAKCVDPATQRPVTVGLVEKMMREAHISLDPRLNAKQQVPPHQIHHLLACVGTRCHQAIGGQVPFETCGDATSSSCSQRTA